MREKDEARKLSLGRICFRKEKSEKLRQGRTNQTIEVRERTREIRRQHWCGFINQNEVRRYMSACLKKKWRRRSPGRNHRQKTSARQKLSWLRRSHDLKSYEILAGTVQKQTNERRDISWTAAHTFGCAFQGYNLADSVTFLSCAGTIPATSTVEARWKDCSRF